MIAAVTALAEIDLDTLARLRAAQSACSCVALVAVPTGTVLCSDAALPLPQDALESIGAEAVALLSDLSETVGCAVLRRPTGVRVVLRRAPGTEAVVAILAPGADPAALIAAWHSLAETR